MNKIIIIFTALIILITLTACGDDKSDVVTSDTAEASVSTEDVSTNTDTQVTVMPRKLDAMEYTLYTNIFYNDQQDMYDDMEYTKEGIFTVMHDSYSNKDRYYVWGYADETLCCDWQWEFIPDDTANLPSPGSLIQMTGIFVADDGALDGYLFTDTTYSIIENYTGCKGDFDTSTMSPTLTRVQLINMLNDPVGHTGEKIVIYGRVYNDNQLQHPYYDNAWYIPLEYADALPAIGTWATVEGTFSGTTFEDSKIIVESVIAD